MRSPRSKKSHLRSSNSVPDTPSPLFSPSLLSDFPEIDVDHLHPDHPDPLHSIDGDYDGNDNNDNNYDDDEDGLLGASDQHLYVRPEPEQSHTPSTPDPALVDHLHVGGHDDADVNSPAHLTGRYGGELEQRDNQIYPPSPLLLYEPNDLPDLSVPTTRLPEDELQAGHIRSPVLAREPTMLESFSRTVRNYVPSSIPIPTAAPTPPRVSRPVSFGRFMSNDGSMSVQSGARNPTADAHEYGSRRLNSDRESAFSPDPDNLDSEPGEGSIHHAYPSHHLDAGDEITWARWDVLANANGKAGRRLLFLCYTTGLQIWDCTDLAGASEILNLSGPSWGRIALAAVLPHPRVVPPSTSTTGTDPFSKLRPMIGISTIREESISTFLVYSLHRHRIVEQLTLPGPATFSSNEHFIVISTALPPTLRILSPATFATLYIVPTQSLAPSITNSIASINTNTNVSLQDVDSDTRGRTTASLAFPVFALSRRLLAYASPQPCPSTPSSTPSSRQPQSQSHSRSPSGGGGLGLSIHMTQADLGNVAIKVGGSMLSGMKSLGGKAYSAAMARAGFFVDPLAPTAAGKRRSSGGGGGGTGSGAVGNFFSRSAPAASNHERRPASDLSDATDSGGGRELNEHYATEDYVPTVAPRTSAVVDAGYYVTVIDLDPLSRGTGADRKPSCISEFRASKYQSISRLEFSADGNSILVSPKDGQLLQIFQLRPAPRVVTAAARLAPEAEHQQLEHRHNTTTPKSSKTPPPRQDAPWHLYNLRRGRTSAVIEGVDWADDGRWVAIGTRKRTIHVFAVNPYGGKPDLRSHMEGRVRNPTELQPLSAEVFPIVRFRASKTPLPHQLRVPLAFTFIQSSERSLPPTLLPPMSTPYSEQSSLPKSDLLSSEPTSPHRHHYPTNNHQHILIFDPTDGVLSLRRFTVEVRSHDQGLSIPSSVPGLGAATSISLPGMSAAGRLSISPPVANARPPGGTSSGNQATDAAAELVGKEKVVATWNLQRQGDWSQIKQVMDVPREERPTRVDQSAKAEFAQVELSTRLAQVELSTHSRSSRILPRQIYLSHQFSFYTLGEDYHAVIRRHQFDIRGAKLEVRKQVQISAYSAGMGESFVEGLSSAPRDMRRAASSFDEPLASALSGGMDYPRPPAVLPMLPNGAPGPGRPLSFRNSIPIRTMAGLSDGMSEGIGRIRREIRKARSPPRPGRGGGGGGGGGGGDDVSGHVPLEFDEEDEDFTGGRMMIGELGPYDDHGRSRTTSRGEVDSGASLSTPSTNAVPLEDDGDDDVWQGWGPEDKQAIDDAEQFDDISSVVGFLDEEHASMVQAEKRMGRRRGH